MPRPADRSEALCALMPGMVRRAQRLTGNRDLAQDLCQEVLLKLWARLQDGQEISDLRAYAMAALRNQYRQALRNQMPGAGTDPAEEAVASDAFAVLALHQLEAAIAALPAPQARLMQLVASGETSPQSLARITGLPAGTVMSRLARARAKLRVKLGLGKHAPTADLL